MRVGFLSEDTRVKLLMQHKVEHDKRVADRTKAVILSDDGWTVEEIAEALLVDKDTVQRYVDAYLIDKQLEPNHKGSKPTLNKEQSDQLIAHLEGNLYTKIKDIREYIKTTFQEEVSNSAIYQWLKKNEFTYKKPKAVPANQDISAQKEFVSFYETLMNEAAEKEEPVLFGDSVHPSQQTRPAYGWVRKGKEYVLEVNSGRKRINVMGALELSTMRLTYKTFDTINSNATIEFFMELEEAYPNAPRIHIILDRAGYHTSIEVQQYLERSRVNVHFLPPRSPNLNSIERLWKVMHEHVSNNRCYKQFKDFREALFTFFDKTLPSIAEQLIDRITDNFHIPEKPPLANTG